MRLVVLLLFLPLAGCVTDPDPIDGEPTCPSWGTSKNSFRFRDSPRFFHNSSIQHDAEAEDLVGSGLYWNRSRPLDRFEIILSRIDVVDQRVSLRVEREDGRALELTRIVPAGIERYDQVHFDAASEPGTYYVHLTEGTRAEPSNMRLVWSAQQNLDGDPETDSVTVMGFQVKYQYLNENCF